jgi:NAD(P)-dependent dehydrogenase (short-subunit alcohol dehydrogenase family)
VSTGLFDLTGRVALVTGASRGIGRAIAVGLARAGARVALTSRTRETLDGVVREIDAELVLQFPMGEFVRR